jgi:membrane protein insertase Oxa1/YidC/SpoIIIJ
LGRYVRACRRGGPSAGPEKSPPFHSERPRTPRAPPPPADNLTLTEPSFATGGALWFTDLVAPDPTRLLPILSAGTWLANVEMGAGLHYEAWPMTRLAARLGAVAFIPLAETVPAGVLVFWLTSNLFALARGGVLRLNAVRRALAIPLQSEILALTHLPKGRPL